MTVRNRSGALRTVNAVERRLPDHATDVRADHRRSQADEKLDGCRGAKTITSHAATPQKKVRRLRVRVKGRFRTIGRYASAIARGTAWTITDRCDRTIIRVTEGTVIVRILRTGRTILTVRAGQTAHDSRQIALAAAAFQGGAVGDRDLAARQRHGAARLLLAQHPVYGRA